MDRRTFLSGLAGLPFIGGLVYGDEVLKNVPPSSMPGYVRDFDSIGELLEYAIHQAKGETHRAVCIHAGDKIYELFTKAVMSEPLKDWQDGVRIWTEKVVDPRKDWDFSVKCYGGHGISHYKIWPVRAFFRLEHKETIIEEVFYSDEHTDREYLVWDKLLQKK